MTATRLALDLGHGVDIIFGVVGPFVIFSTVVFRIGGIGPPHPGFRHLHPPPWLIYLPVTDFPGKRSHENRIKIQFKHHLNILCASPCGMMHPKAQEVELSTAMVCYVIFLQVIY